MPQKQHLLGVLSLDVHETNVIIISWGISDSEIKTIIPIPSKAYKDKLQQYKDSPDLIRSVAADGCEKARKIAKDTMREVREEMGIDF